MPNHAPDQTELRRFIESGSAPYSKALETSARDLGLDADKVDGDLRLKRPVELLDAERIAGWLPEGTAVDVHWEVDSTNTLLMSQPELLPEGGCRICLAERQTAGRGRRGRNWVSPFGANLYMSVARRFRKDGPTLGGLSLVVGMQIVRGLRAAGVDGVGLKWPNDILMGSGKLAGILVEVGSPAGGSLYTVTGIGLNLRMDPSAAGAIDQPFSTLEEHVLSRNDLAGRLLSSVLAGIEEFSRSGFAPFFRDWPSVNLYQGRPVKVLIGGDYIEGMERGIDAQGNLQVESGGTLRSFNAGEVSLRAES